MYKKNYLLISDLALLSSSYSSCEHVINYHMWKCSWLFLSLSLSFFVLVPCWRCKSASSCKKVHSWTKNQQHRKRQVFRLNEFLSPFQPLGALSSWWFKVKIRRFSFFSLFLSLNILVTLVLFLLALIGLTCKNNKRQTTPGYWLTRVIQCVQFSFEFCNGLNQ